ncbi:hypothetical protein [Planomonospora sp. ID82291]|uniref:hypothetical protein n=1 Tax=Planomonospora sp. ID82291 TaxID=2738136 RepID=UPI0018C3DA9D|nr:hypothetical protein [Planomonospora sp. ID82291]MBG0817883.1 hypothetical protein [Planomonospora sp. ID82291]
MTVFACASCGQVLSGDLRRLAGTPAHAGPDRSTVPPGCYAIDPEPFGAPFATRAFPEERPARRRAGAAPRQAPVSAGKRGTVVVHPHDAPSLRAHPDAARSSGCCGPCGSFGPNMTCGCGVALATLVADCHGPYELRLDPVRVYAFDAVTGRPETLA